MQKFRLRITLLSALLGLILLTVSLLGVITYINAHDTAVDLSGQILGQMALRIEQRVDVLRHFGKLNRTELSLFLQSLEKDKNVVSFIAEVRSDGSHDLVAQSDPSVRHFAGTHIGRFSFQHLGATYIGVAHRIEGAGHPTWIAGVAVPKNDILGLVAYHNHITLAVGFAACLLALAVGLYVSILVAKPLELIAQETEAIGRFELEANNRVQSSILEVDRLALAIDHMKTGLRSFGKFVPKQLVRSLMASGQEARLGGERRELTICFSDIKDFTSVSEKMAPEELVKHLGDYLDLVSKTIQSNRGTIDKYIGDAVMAFWNAPTATDDHAYLACCAALQNQAALRDARREWQRLGKPVFITRIGIHTGEAIVGNVGSELFMNYTAIGDSVNLASRLEGLNKTYETEILISESTYEKVKDRIVARPVDRVTVKGKTQPVEVYELVALK